MSLSPHAEANSKGLRRKKHEQFNSNKQNAAMAAA